MLFPLFSPSDNAIVPLPLTDINNIGCPIKKIEYIFFKITISWKISENVRFLRDRGSNIGVYILFWKMSCQVIEDVSF